MTLSYTREEFSNIMNLNDIYTNLKRLSEYHLSKRVFFEEHKLIGKELVSVMNSNVGKSLFRQCECSVSMEYNDNDNLVLISFSPSVDVMLQGWSDQKLLSLYWNSNLIDGDFYIYDRSKTRSHIEYTHKRLESWEQFFKLTTALKPKIFDINTLSKYVYDMIKDRNYNERIKLMEEWQYETY
jgi:hypothetical protein